MARPAETLTVRETYQTMGISKRQFYRLKQDGRFDHLEAPIPHRYSKVKVLQFLHGRDALSAQAVRS